MSTVSIPQYISFKDWVGNLNVVFPSLNIPIDKGEEKWRDWVTDLIKVNSLNFITLPDEKFFSKIEDWRNWAYFFIQDMQRLS